MKAVGITLFISFLLVFEYCPAQIETGAGQHLIVVHKNKNKCKVFRTNKKITLYNKDGYKYKGELSIINDTVIAIDSLSFYFSEINKVGGKSAGLKVMKVVGGSLAAGGTLLGGLGGLLIMAAYKDNSCGAVFVLAFGYVFVLAGTTATLIGAIPLVFSNRKYEIGKKWNLLIVDKIPESRDEVEKLRIRLHQE